MADADAIKAPEPFVSAGEAAKFLSIERRFLLALARKGLPGAYPIGTGEVRKLWVFRLSELSSAIAPTKPSAALIQNSAKRGTIRSGSPR